MTVHILRISLKRTHFFAKQNKLDLCENWELPYEIGNLVIAHDRNLDRPGIPASLVKMRPYHRGGLRCEVSQPGAICSRHNAEARRAENAGRENSSFFFFFLRHSCEFFSEGEDDKLFSLDAGHSFRN